ncbi:hypothetical protein DSECCO2_477820 [anaerobic digester metagenome]
MFPCARFLSTLGQAEMLPSARMDAMCMPARQKKNPSRTFSSYLPTQASQLNDVFMRLSFRFSIMKFIRYFNCSPVSERSLSLAARPMGVIVNNRHDLIPV